MIKAVKKKFLDIETILSKISEYDIYRNEIGVFTIGRAICNPLRKDNNPSFTIRHIEGGKEYLKHKDHADETYCGGPVDFVMQKYGIGYTDAIKKIAKDFGIEKGGNTNIALERRWRQPTYEECRSAFIQVSVKKWDKESLSYWAAYGITQEELRKEDVYPVREWFLNRKKQLIRDKELCFCYRYPNGFKIYYPGRSKGEGKWFSNIPCDTIENLSCINGSPITVIAKSKKDRLILEKFTHEVISIQNESTAFLKTDILERLRGKKVYIAGDSDEPGKKFSRRLTMEMGLGFSHVNVPDEYLAHNVKDFADFYRLFGAEKVEEHLKKKGVI